MILQQPFLIGENMKIEIKNEYLSATINLFGAYIENFCKYGNPIFFPKVVSKIGDKLKARGGMHPCLPNFGPDEISNLNQHGFARNNKWQLVDKANDFVKLKLLGIDDYVDVEFVIEYRLEKDGLLTRLNIKNTSSSEKNIGPGFHPYFYCENMNIEIEGFDIEKDKLEDTIFLEVKKIQAKIGKNNIRISGKNVNVFAIWTDFFGDYICIEPTLNSKSFTKEINRPYILKAKEEFSQEFVINIEGN